MNWCSNFMYKLRYSKRILKNIFKIYHEHKLFIIIKVYQTRIKSNKKLHMRTDHEFFIEILVLQEQTTIKISLQDMASNIS